MQRIPVIVRAIIVGLIVTSAASLPWGILVQANLRAATALPWAAALMVAYLFVYLGYLNGWGWPRSTGAFRKDSLRAISLPLRVWGWSLLSGISAFASSIALLLVVRRMIPWPVAAEEYPARLSPLFIVVTLLVSAAVAGVSEESGFRGYMQRILEGRYGPTTAILLSSVVFGLAHLTHGLRPVPLLFDAVWGALYGILAYLSGSIIPGMILHSSLDFIEFLVAWRRVLPLRPLVWQSGPDHHFWGTCAAAIILALVAVWAFRCLAAITKHMRTCDGGR